MVIKGLNLINGEWVEGSGESFTSINPANDKVLWEGRESTKNDVDQAIAAGSKAFKVWSRFSMEKRIALLNDFVALLTEEKPELALLISQETGKPLWESMSEVQAMINKLLVSLSSYKERCAHVSKSIAGASRFTRFKPHGVVGVFGPFNLPGHLPNGHIIPALLAGNTVVFKPSEQTPAVGQKMIELWEKSGIPHGVVNLVHGSKETGVALSKSTVLSGLFFTGSSQVGIEIHKSFAGHPEKVLALEMGGNNPLLVFDVENYQAAAYMTIQSAFITSGQRCTCARRLIVSNGKKGEEFLNALTSMMAQIRVESFSEEPEPFMGPVISAAAAKQVLQVQESLLIAGADSLVEMKQLDCGEAFISPGLIDVTDVDDLEDQEIFGPLLQVTRVSNIDEALTKANETVYGLSAGLLSDNEELYEKFVDQIQAGIVNWNRPTTGASSEAPFGGIGQSGNHNPSAYFAADYCSYPVASVEQAHVRMPERVTPGINLE